ncbi:putative glycosyltransferase [groundwater metagenome]|uniref:Putative glycosyltransferase n=1 Tax=groundwater metagenome TaxID=717931 RepID=A0A098E5S2_9ZZZZ
MNPKISVIIAARNEEKNIEKCLRNIPEYKNLEVIVVDDSSNDKTYEIAKNFKADYDLKIFRNETPKGNAYSWDHGVKKSSGELIFLLSADAELNSFDDAIKHFDDPKVVQVHQKVKIIGEENNFISKFMPIYQRYANYIPFIKKGIRKETELKNVNVCDSHALMRKSFYLEVNPLVDKACGEEYRFNDVGGKILDNKGYKVVYESKFIEIRRQPRDMKSFLIQQRWYGRNMLVAYSLFDKRNIPKFFRYALIVFLILALSYFFTKNYLLFVLTIFSCILLLARLFSGIPSLKKKEIVYLPFIFWIIILGDLAYNYGFLQSFLNKIFAGKWLINK